MQARKQSLRALPLFVTLVLLLLPLGGHVSAQAPVGMGIVLQGGPSWSLGSSFENIPAGRVNVVQPEGNAGIYVTFLQRFRAGLDFSYTRMVREQVNGTLQPMGADGTYLPGSVEGTVYRDFKTHFYAAGVKAEYNLLPSAGPFALYAGTGAGCLIGAGTTWSMSVRNEMRAGEGKNIVSVKGHNELHRYVAAYIPASLSAEFTFLPQVSLCVGGTYRLVLSKEEIAPKHQVCATLGLRIQLIR